MKPIQIIAILISILQLGFSNPVDAQNNDLSSKEKSFISIASLTAKGDLDKLKPVLAEGLENGLTVNQIKEALVHLYAYCGFPRSLRGLQTFIKVLDERKAKGIQDKWGAEASPIEDTRPKYDRGKEVLEKLVQMKLDGPKADYARFSPIIEVFLKEHLFADIFERDVLNYQQRELVTVSVLITIGDVEPMLRSHMNICLKQGITPVQLEQVIETVKPNINRKKKKSARNVLTELLKNKL